MKKTASFFAVALILCFSLGSSLFAQTHKERHQVTHNGAALIAKHPGWNDSQTQDENFDPNQDGAPPRRPCCHHGRDSYAYQNFSFSPPNIYPTCYKRSPPGPTGPTGPQGDTGPAGPQGDTGSTLDFANPVWIDDFISRGSTGGIGYLSWESNAFLGGPDAETNHPGILLFQCKSDKYYYLKLILERGYHIEMRNDPMLPIDKISPKFDLSYIVQPKTPLNSFLGGFIDIDSFDTGSVPHSGIYVEFLPQTGIIRAVIKASDEEISQEDFGAILSVDNWYNIRIRSISDTQISFTVTAFDINGASTTYGPITLTRPETTTYSVHLLQLAFVAKTIDTFNTNAFSIDAVKLQFPNCVR